MFLDFIFGFFIVIPVLIGAFGYPWVIWKRLDTHFLNKRGVPWWQKIGVAVAVLIPTILVFVVFGLLMQWLDVGGSTADWQRAREVAPRAIPPEVYPMAIGMLIGIVGLTPFFTRLSRKLPYFNMPEEGVIAEPRRRTTKSELHRLEWHVKSMFLPLRGCHIDAVPLADIPAFAGAPPHIKNRFYQDFLGANFLVITRRTVDASSMKPKDISYSLNCAIVAENDDCLQYTRSLAREPVVKLKGAQLLALLKDDAAVLVSQPEIQIRFSAQDLSAIKTFES